MVDMSEPLTTTSSSLAGTSILADPAALFSLVLYATIAMCLVVLLLLLAWFLGQRTRSRVKGEPYESGIAATGNARLSEPAPFYLVAIFFIVFDVEMIFVASWSIAFEQLGWAGYFQITFFIFVLFLGLVWLWKMGGLDWGPNPRRHLAEKAKR